MSCLVWDWDQLLGQSSTCLSVLQVSVSIQVLLRPQTFIPATLQMLTLFSSALGLSLDVKLIWAQESAWCPLLMQLSSSYAWQVCYDSVHSSELQLQWNEACDKVNQVSGLKALTDYSIQVIMSRLYVQVSNSENDQICISWSYLVVRLRA